MYIRKSYFIISAHFVTPVNHLFKFVPCLILDYLIMATIPCIESSLPESWSIIRIVSTDLEMSLLLQESLTSHFAMDTGSISQRTKPQLPDFISIHNKYFSATLCLQELSAVQAETGKGVDEGFILVFRGTNHRGGCTFFDSATALHEKADAQGECGDLLRLCVAVTAYDGHEPDEFTSECVKDKEKEEEYSRRVQWCLDRGYEYVEADMTTQGLSFGHNLRDKDGFARIVEALGSTVWSTASMHPRVAASTTRFAMSQESEIININEQESQSNALGDEENEATETDFLDDEDDRNLDQLELLIHEARRIRDAAQTGSISDHERREQASEMAIKLLDAMGIE